MKTQVITETHRYVVCPHCEKKAGRIDHLEAPTHVQWYCDECGHEYRVTFDTDINIEALTDNRVVKTWDLLVLPPQTEPVYFLVEGNRYTGKHVFQRDDATEANSKRFYYEEHSCPTNWLQPKLVAINGNTDPHGLIKFVRHVDDSDVPPPAIDDWRHDHEWLPVFPELAPK